MHTRLTDICQATGIFITMNLSASVQCMMLDMWTNDSVYLCVKCSSE